ncbi:MAG: topoisomerase C-terminal repeat-containing protein [Clostridia bacterium]|nr:topoisomerase C-terminal repeat-containing protein [Clostridia bacterium]
MVLIIAEKPSLARNIAAGIGKMTRRDGYLEGEGYLVTWAFGHLFSLCDIESYQGGEPSARWTLDKLPCIPEKFQFELKRDKDKKHVDAGVKKQFGIITALCNRPDVDTIVNAGDADREGEVIVRLCVQHALKAPKAQKRLWLPDQTPETVAEALRNLGDAENYQNLANEGLARTYMDWLFGVNLTRYATIKCGTLLRVGRVIAPIVRAIYDRDMSIRNFVVGKYFVPYSNAETNGERVELTSKQKFDDTKEGREKAGALCAAMNAAGAVVKSVKRKKDTIQPGKLYSLSKLQNVLGKKYKMSMADSLAVIQGLYEKGYLTYPRTNSEYLATAEKDKMRKIIAQCKNLGYAVCFKDSPKIFDDSKIESHSALTPTYKIPKKGELTDRENMVYATVFRRFVAVFCAEPCQAERTEITVAVGDIEEFVLKGLVILERGWMKYDDATQKDKVLPKLSKGDVVNVAFAPREKETTPPKHYTIETLNNYLKNPFREEKAAAEAAAEEQGDAVGADDAEEYRAVFEGLELGTEATRTGIIDNARKSGYIALNKDVYTILPGGEYLIESLDRLEIRMDKFRTSEMGRALKRVFRGEMTVEESVALAAAEVKAVFDKKEQSIEEDTEIGVYGEEVGACPLCGKRVVRGKFSYGCTGYKEGCEFRVNTSICGRVISAANMRLLLTEGKTSKIKGFVSKKSGKPFDAALRLQDGKAVFDFST